jgi:hypothetical protein
MMIGRYRIMGQEYARPTVQARVGNRVTRPGGSRVAGRPAVRLSRVIAEPTLADQRMMR